MAYKPIESYGVIGDLHTAALVGMDGSIDWCCLPHFDSPSIFAAILDERKGGFFKIASLYEAQHKQMYLPDSNVLVWSMPRSRSAGRRPCSPICRATPTASPSPIAG
jgi:GH15 family glucan-1,4-alpha-glucosidase